MKLLLVLVVLVAVVLAIAIVVQRRKQAGQSAAPRSDPFGSHTGLFDPRRLKVGDVVGFEGHDFVVRGTLRMTQSGAAWAEHLLDDTRRRVWLSVEDDEGLVLCVWERRTEAALQPGAPKLSYEGVEFHLSERGDATFLSEGTTGTPPSGTMDYVDYAAGEERLAFERFGTASWELSRGRVVGERELTIYPVSR